MKPVDLTVACVFELVIASAFVAMVTSMSLLASIAGFILPMVVMPAWLLIRADVRSYVGFDGHSFRRI